MQKNTYKKYQALIMGKVWQERDIISFRSFLVKNIRWHGAQCAWDGTTNRLKAQELLDCFEAAADKKPYRITAEQTEKGLNWLRQACFTTSGEIRNSKSRPFEYWECQKLKALMGKFSHWTFDGLDPMYNDYSGEVQGYAAIYTLHAKGGGSFTYVAHPMGWNQGCRVTCLQSA